MGFEPREVATLAGRSGQTHQFNALGVDEKKRRLLVFSGELDPRMAAMVHSDVAANIGGYRLITVRPLTFDIQQLASLIGQVTGTEQFDSKEILSSFQEWSKSEPWTAVRPAKDFDGMSAKDILSIVQLSLGAAASILMPFLRAATLSGLSPTEQIMLMVRQLSLLDWRSFVNASKSSGVFDLSHFTELDSLKWDREFGLCPFPLYELHEHDWETISSAKDIERIRERLTEMGVTQYFSPPKDHATLAVIDRGIQHPKDIEGALQTLPELGHPIASNEFLENSTDLIDIIAQLQQSGLTVEGDAGVTISEKGREFRASVKFRPREGAISKVLNILKVNVNVSPKDWM